MKIDFDIGKKIKKFMFNRASMAFKGKYGEEFPLDFDNIDTLIKLHKQQVKETIIVYELLRADFIAKYGTDAFSKYEKASEDRAQYVSERWEETIGQIIITILLVQGFKLAEVRKMEADENAGNTP